MYVIRKEGRLHRMWHGRKEKRTKQDGQTHLSWHRKDSLQCSSTPMSCGAYMKAICAEKEETEQIQDGTRWSWPLALLGPDMESGSSSELITFQLLFAQVTEKTLSPPRTSYPIKPSTVLWCFTNFGVPSSYPGTFHDADCAVCIA